MAVAKEIGDEKRRIIGPTETAERVDENTSSMPDVLSDLT